jgi:hypothetical protein
MIGGGTKAGLMYYCCWPCICDTLDFLRVDTKTVQLAGGVSRQYNFAVMGDPCKNSAALTTPYICPFSGRTTTIPQQAPEIKCGADGALEGATKSDNGHIIMAMFFEDQGQPSMEQSYFTGFAGSPCEKRAAGGYKSGMGLIFRKVASASPISSFVVQEQATARLFRTPSKTSLGSAAVQKPDYILTCPNGESGVSRASAKQLVNISQAQLLTS